MKSYGDKCMREQDGRFFVQELTYFTYGTKVETGSLTNVTCGTSDMASSKTTPIFFADGAADTMSLSIQTEFRVGLGRRPDEITNYSDLSPFNFRSLCVYMRKLALARVSHWDDF